MKLKLFFSLFGSATILSVAGLGSTVYLTSCESDNNQPTNNIELSNLTADGSAHTTATSHLSFNVSKAVESVTMYDIVVTDITTPEVEISVTILHKTGLDWSVDVSGLWYDNDEVELTINKTGYEFSSVTTHINAHSQVYVDYLTADGHTDDLTTTKVILETDSLSSGEMFGLIANDIEFTNVTEPERIVSAKNITCISHYEYEIAIEGNWNNGDEIQISEINHYQILENKSVHIYKDSTLQANVVSIQANGSSENELTTELTIETNVIINSLTDRDITLTNITDSNKKVYVSHLSVDTTAEIPTYIVGINGEWNNGDNIFVSIEKHGYHINPDVDNDVVTIYGVVSALSSLSANGKNKKITTNTLTLTSAKPLGELAESNISIAKTDSTSTDVLNLTIEGVTEGESPSVYLITILGTWTNGISVTLSVTKQNYLITNTVNVLLYQDIAARTTISGFSAIQTDEVLNVLSVAFDSTIELDTLTNNQIKISDLTTAHDDIVVSGLTQTHIEQLYHYTCIATSATAFANSDQIELVIESDDYIVSNEGECKTYVASYISPYDFSGSHVNSSWVVHLLFYSKLEITELATIDITVKINYIGGYSTITNLDYWYSGVNEAYIYTFDATFHSAHAYPTAGNDVLIEMTAPNNYIFNSESYSIVLN